MPTISASIQLYDQMTAPLNKIITALHQTVSSLYDMQSAMGTNMDTSSLDAANQAINEANASMAQLENTISSINRTTIEPKVQMPDTSVSEPNVPNAKNVQPVKVPVQAESPDIKIPNPEPVKVPVEAETPDIKIPDVQPVKVPVEWETNNLDVFTSTGVERFEQEIQSANQMMNQMVQNQNKISNAAAGIKILPDNAAADFNSINQRIAALQTRLQQLNNTPVVLRTDEINNQIEQLRSNLNQIISEQNDLNDAMSRMGVGDINASYQQLSATVGNTERYIRDNTNEQGNFNEAIQNGVNQSDQLMNSIKGVVSAYLSIQGVKKVLDISDELTQTTARLGMMNESFNQINGTAMETNDLVKLVYQSAQNARGSFSDMAAVVAKFGNNARDAFSSQEEVVEFANLVQKQMTIAGASTAEASNAMLQLSQALGSGVLRGDELNSIFEQAPNLIQSIADYMDVPIGKIREMASEGELSADVVKQAIFASADDINAKFNQMPMTWNQVWTAMANTATMQFQPVLDKVNELANNEQFQSMIIGIMNGLAMIAVGLLQIMEYAGQVASFFQDNWSIIEPIIMGIVAALGAYLVVAMIVNAINGIMAITEQVKAAAQMMATGATFAETAAQYGLNAALAACPITWIIVLIIAAIAAIFAAASAIARLTGIANTGFGVITGGINVVIQFFRNLGLSVANIALGIGNALGAVAQNMVIAFQNAVARVQQFFYNLLATVSSVISSIAAALNKLPFVHFDYSGITRAANTYASKASAAASKQQSYKDIGAAFSKGFNTFDTFQSGWVSDAFKSGASWGDGAMDKINGMLSGFGNIQANGIDTSKMFTGGGYTAPDFGNYDASQLPKNVADTAANTAKTADKLDITDEDLKYLRDIAERDVVNRFTTAEIKVEMTNNNNVSSDMDLDGIVDYLANGVQEAMEVAAEGVHV